MITLLTLLLMITQAQPSGPEDSVCEPVAGAEAKTVAWLRGEYRQFGLKNAMPYAGKIVLSGSETSETLWIARERDGKKVIGNARIVRCGPDAVRQIEVQWQHNKGRQYCVWHHDYDNLNRLTCSAGLSEPEGDIEAWFQRVRPNNSFKPTLLRGRRGDTLDSVYRR